MPRANPVVKALNSIGFVPAGSGVDACLRTDAGTVIVEAKTGIAGVREFRAATAQVALSARKEGIHRSLLLLWEPRLSREALIREWRAVGSILAPSIAARLQLVAVWPESWVAVPQDDLAETIARQVRSAHPRQALPRETSFETLRILLARWLLGQPPIAIKDLQAAAGLSYPTVAKSLRALSESLLRGPKRSVALRSFPGDEWQRLLSRANLVRQTEAYEDRAGRAGSSSRLLDGLDRLELQGVALGGVVAARYWDPELDLDGVPRVDLTVHVPAGEVRDLLPDELDELGIRWRRVALDPAAPLNIHKVTRPTSLFTTAREKGLPYADPVEVLLDLHELRLERQAEEFVRNLRRRHSIS